MYKNILQAKHSNTGITMRGIKLVCLAAFHICVVKSTAAVIQPFNLEKYMKSKEALTIIKNNLPEGWVQLQYTMNGKTVTDYTKRSKRGARINQCKPPLHECRELNRYLADKFKEENKECADCGITMTSPRYHRAKNFRYFENPQWGICVCKICVVAHESTHLTDMRPFGLDSGVTNYDIECFRRGGNKYTNSTLGCADTIRNCINISKADGENRAKWIKLKYPGYNTEKATTIQELCDRAAQASQVEQPVPIAASKKGNSNRGFKRRYFVFRTGSNGDGAIKYFADQDLTKSKGGITHVREIKAVSKKPLEIVLVGKGFKGTVQRTEFKDYKIKFTSEDDKNAFIILASKLLVEEKEQPAVRRRRLLCSRARLKALMDEINALNES